MASCSSCLNLAPSSNCYELQGPSSPLAFLCEPCLGFESVGGCSRRQRQLAHSLPGRNSQGTLQHLLPLLLQFGPCKPEAVLRGPGAHPTTHEEVSGRGGLKGRINTPGRAVRTPEGATTIATNHRRFSTADGGRRREPRAGSARDDAPRGRRHTRERGAHSAASLPR
jgi:hypothetical protein